MFSDEFYFRLPSFTVLLLGLLLCLIRMRKEPLSSILGAAGFAYALLHFFLYTKLSESVRSLFQDPAQAQKFSNLALSSSSAVSLYLYLLAIITSGLGVRPGKGLEDKVTLALAMKKNRSDDDQIRSELRQTGVSEESVETVLQAADTLLNRKVGVRNIFVGTLICFLGIGVSLASFLMAANAPGGGKFMVTSGIILWGVALVTRGFAQLSR